MKKYIPVILLLIIFFIQVIASVSTKSPVADAAAHHIASGYSYVRTGDFRMNPSAPPLLRIFMGLPLLSMHLNLPTDHPSWPKIDSIEFHRQFLFVYNNNAERIVFLSRLPMILISTFLGLLIFVWSDKLYGYKAGLFALLLFVFSPTILGNAGLAMLDTGCAFFIFLALFQLWRYLNDKSLLNLVLTGICFGLAQSTKITSVMLYPLFGFFILSDAVLNRREKGFLFGKALINLIIILIIGIIVLWATYLFEFKPLLQNAPDVEEKIEYIKKFSALIPFIDSSRLTAYLIYFAKHIPIPLSTYIVTLLGVVNITLSNYPLYFMGSIIYGGSRIYYIIDYLIKTPLPMLMLIFFSGLLIKRRTRLEKLKSFFITVPIIVFFGISALSKLQGGLRYILPMYPFLFMWVSDIVNIELKRFRRGFRALLVVLCLWYITSSALTYPNYLAYFNEFVGGAKGWGHKITADADWGQDFKLLKRYMDEKGIRDIVLHCFGTAEPGYYGITYRHMSTGEFKRPLPGVYYAISLRYLPDAEWADSIKPIGVVGNNIYIYYINEDMADEQ